MKTLKMLELSTGHIPFNEKALLDRWANYTNEYGWIIWAEKDTTEFGDDAPILAFILRYARKHQCDYVLFDGDADVNDDLPTFTWPAKAGADEQEGA